MRGVRVWALSGLLIAGLGCRTAPGPDPAMVSAWMQTLYGVVRAERLTPPVASRFLGYAAVSLYEGLAVATPELPSLGGVLQGLETLPRAEAGVAVDPTLVAVASERIVLASLLEEALPTTRAAVAALVDSLVTARTGAGVSDAVRQASEELGGRIGAAVVAWAAADGFAETRRMAYRPPVGPQYWVNDSTGSLYAARNVSGVSQSVALDDPTNTLRAGEAADRNLIVNRPKSDSIATLPVVDMAGATEPYWGRLRPFLLTRWDECPIPAPPPYATDTAAELHRESRELIEIGRALTPEQRAIAYYWADNPGETATPAGHWLAIASQMIGQQGLDASDAARLFVLTAAAQADAFIAGWGYKYQFSQIRPRTYIRRLIEPVWEPLIPTPPFPEYPSGHSTQSAAAATVIEAVVGPIAFVDSSGVIIGNAPRAFPSLEAAAEEAGWSRIYGGIHFHSGKNAGKVVGQCIGQRAVERVAAAIGR